MNSTLHPFSGTLYTISEQKTPFLKMIQYSIRNTQKANVTDHNFCIGQQTLTEREACTVTANVFGGYIYRVDITSYDCAHIHTHGQPTGSGRSEQLAVHGTIPDSCKILYQNTMLCAYTNFSYTRIHTCNIHVSTRMKSAEERLVIFIPNCTGKALDSRMVIDKLWRKNTHSTTKLTLLARIPIHYVNYTCMLTECEWTHLIEEN